MLFKIFIVFKKNLLNNNEQQRKLLCSSILNNVFYSTTQYNETIKTSSFFNKLAKMEKQYKVKYFLKLDELNHETLNQISKTINKLFLTKEDLDKLVEKLVLSPEIYEIYLNCDGRKKKI